jgi:chromate transport protein ChrA
VRGNGCLGRIHLALGRRLGALHGLKIVAVAVVAQAVPGPLLTFAAFLGASMQRAPSGILGGAICLLAIFAPSFLLVVGALPFWEQVPYFLTLL